MNIYTGAQSNNKKSQEILCMVVWTGVVKFYNNGAQEVLYVGIIRQF